MKLRDFVVCGVGVALGIILAFHVVTGMCRSQNYFTWGNVFLCKQQNPFQ